MVSNQRKSKVGGRWDDRRSPGSAIRAFGTSKRSATALAALPEALLTLRHYSAREGPVTPVEAAGRHWISQRTAGQDRHWRRGGRLARDESGLLHIDERHVPSELGFWDLSRIGGTRGRLRAGRERLRVQDPPGWIR